jgi:glutaredoxin-related protein
MSKPQLVFAWALLCWCFNAVSAYPDKDKPIKYELVNDKQLNSAAREIAPELMLKESDFTYNSYKDSLKRIKDILDEYEQGKKYNPYSEMNYIGIPNSLLQLEGYGLITQRDLLRLKLENAKLIRAEQEEARKLEKALEEAEKQISVFLGENIWVD